MNNNAEEQNLIPEQKEAETTTNGDPQQHLENTVSSVLQDDDDQYENDQSTLTRSVPVWQPEKSSGQISPPLTKPAPAGFKLFVGQLPFHFTESHVQRIFQEFGTVTEAAVIRNRSTGQHKGCAFVSFTTKEAAENAIQSLHNVRVAATVRQFFYLLTM